MRIKPTRKTIRVIHNPGPMNNIAIRNKFYEGEIPKITCSSEITIVSVMNDKYIADSYLMKQCQANNIELVIPESTRLIESKNWKNTYKINGILEALDHIQTNYVLFLDGRDVKLVNDLDQDFINDFLSFNVDIVFNGNDHIWPGKELENEIGKNKSADYFALNYINAGVCIGKTAAMKKFYQECLDYIEVNHVNYEFKPSEQLVVRTVATLTSVKIDTDDHSKMFTNFFKYSHMEN